MRYAILLVIALTLFAACDTQPVTENEVPEQETTTPPPTMPPEDRPLETIEQVIEVPEDERTTAQRVFGSDESPTHAVPAEVESMIARAEERTANGYQFYYHTRTDGLPGNAVYEGKRIFVRGNVIVAELERVQQLPGTLDEANRIGVTSQGQERAWCTSCNEPSFQSDQGLTDLPPPTVWLYYIEDIEVEGQQTIDGRSAMRITATMQDETIELFIDEFSGLPLRVTWQGTEYRYERVAFGVSEDQVTIP